jgi:hypothetical protein
MPIATTPREKKHISDLLQQDTPTSVVLDFPGIVLPKAECQTYEELFDQLKTLVDAHPGVRGRLHLEYTSGEHHERTVFLGTNTDIIEVGDEIWVKANPTCALSSGAVFKSSSGLKPRLHRGDVEKYRR